MTPAGRPTAPVDAGTGVIGMVAGLLVFLALVLLAVQTLVALQVRSVLGEAAYEGARAVAGARVDHADAAAVVAARVAAEERVRGLLGRYGDRVSLDWSASSDDVVALTVRARPPGFLWAALRGPGERVVQRTVRVRVEVLR